MDPMGKFIELLELAKRTAGIVEPTAMTLSTVGADGQPSARVVLIKGADTDGLVFYTNYNSRKAREILARPAVALTFWWPLLESQVRVDSRPGRLHERELYTRASADAPWSMTLLNP